MGAGKRLIGEEKLEKAITTVEKQNNIKIWETLSVVILGVVATGGVLGLLLAESPLLYPSFGVAVLIILINTFSFEYFVAQNKKGKATYMGAVTVLELLACFKMGESCLLYLIPFSILMVMTASDLETMEVPTWTLLMLPGSSLVAMLFAGGVDIPSRLITMVIAVAILVLVSYKYNWMLGGADIFMVGSFCLLFDYFLILILVILGCLMSIIYAILNMSLNKTSKDEPFAFLPGLTAGLYLGILSEGVLFQLLM